MQPSNLATTEIDQIKAENQALLERQDALERQLQDLSPATGSIGVSSTMAVSSWKVALAMVFLLSCIFGIARLDNPLAQLLYEAEANTGTVTDIPVDQFDLRRESEQEANANSGPTIQVNVIGRPKSERATKQRPEVNSVLPLPPPPPPPPPSPTPTTADSETHQGNSSAAQEPADVWTETKGIRYCSGSNLGDESHRTMTKWQIKFWKTKSKGDQIIKTDGQSMALVVNGDNCPHRWPDDWNDAQVVSECKAICSSVAECTGFTYYPATASHRKDGSTTKECCMRASTFDKPTCTTASCADTRCYERERQSIVSQLPPPPPPPSPSVEIPSTAAAAVHDAPLPGCGVKTMLTDWQAQKYLLDLPETFNPDQHYSYADCAGYLNLYHLRSIHTYRDCVSKTTEMTGFYHTVLKFPELDIDNYSYLK